VFLVDNYTKSVRVKYIASREAIMVYIQLYIRMVTDLSIKSAVEKNVFWPRLANACSIKLFNLTPGFEVASALTPGHSELTAAGTVDPPRAQEWCGAAHCAEHRDLPQQGDGRVN
jgi:hypothetical protein